MAAWAQPLTAPRGTAITPQDRATDFPVAVISLRAWHLHFQSQAGLPFCVPPSLLSGGSGILTGCPSPTPFGLGLGPTNPTRINLPSETLDLRGTRFSRVLRYSCQDSHFCQLHRSSRYGFHADRTLPYRCDPLAWSSAKQSALNRPQVTGGLLHPRARKQELQTIRPPTRGSHPAASVPDLSPVTFSAQHH